MQGRAFVASQSFNLVIEHLLFSTIGEILHTRADMIGFNLVIEHLLFSTDDHEYIRDTYSEVSIS